MKTITLIVEQDKLKDQRPKCSHSQESCKNTKPEALIKMQRT